MPKPIYSVTIEGDTVIKKNSRVIFRKHDTGKPFIGKSERLRTAEHAAIWQMRSARGSTITQDVLAVFTFYTRTKRRVDLSNAYQLYEDALEKAEVLLNDNQIRAHDGSRQLYDPFNPRIEIKLFPFSDSIDNGVTSKATL